jgi:hypothetical protein
LAVVLIIAPACGCGCLGWYQAAGHLPGIAATDYAFYNFCGTSSQLHPFTPRQTESSVLEAMGDLGYRVLEPPMRRDGGGTLIRARAADGRPVQVLITPQNAMTNLRVTVGPAHIGDESLSRELQRRVALNYGTGIRAYTPVETTLPRRFNPSRGLPPIVSGGPPRVLQGEGLRPTERRERATGEEELPPGTEAEPPMNRSVPMVPFRDFIPTRDFPNAPNMPYAPWPYMPFDDGQG